MAIDPVDDCTFWYTTEYNRSYSLYWRTRIASFKFPNCTPQPTRTPTPTVTGTPPTNTPTRTPTNTPTATATPTVCTLQFNDVPSNDPFYPYVTCLACRGVVTGYPCGGEGEPCPGTYFRPGWSATRGQVAKMISVSAGYAEVTTIESFTDVPETHPFWQYVERSLLHEVVNGYPCGSIPEEPCDEISHRYFRPNTPATRGQLAKMVSLGAQYNDEIPSNRQTYEDVPSSNTFWVYVERLTWRGIVNGYPCGGMTEPCVPPTNRPYFRPDTIATRSQAAKTVSRAFFPGCNPPPESQPVNITPVTTTTPQVSVTPSPVVSTTPTSFVPSPVPSVPAPLPSVPVPVATGPVPTPAAPK